MKQKHKKYALSPLKGAVEVVFLKKENDLNKILKNQKRSKETLNLLFTSPWDTWSEDLVSQLVKKYEGQEAKSKLYIVDSFFMPHSFVIYGSSKVPHLVRLVGDRVLSEDYLPGIHHFFGLR